MEMFMDLTIKIMIKNMEHMLYVNHFLRVIDTYNDTLLSQEKSPVIKKHSTIIPHVFHPFQLTFNERIMLWV